MPPIRPLLHALVLAVALAPVAHAEGLLDAYRAAADSDPGLAAAAANRSASAELLPQARAGLRPQVTANLQQGLDIDPSAATHSYGITLVQPLYRKAPQVQASIAEARIERAEADYTAASQDLMLSVAERYFAVLNADDERSFRDAETTAIARQLDQATRRFEVGLTTITDVHEARARNDLAAAERIRAENAYTDSLAALRELTGQEPGALRKLRADTPLAGPQPADPQAWSAQALTSNPRVLAAAHDAAAAERQVALQRTGDDPTLDLIAGYSDADSGSFDSRGGSVGVQLTIPLYQGGAVRSRSREAAHRHDAARQALEAVRRATERRALSAYRGLQAAVSRVDALRQAVISTQSALEATEAGFEVGTRTIVDVLNAQTDLNRAQRDYAQARYEHLLNGLRLKHAAGQLQTGDLEAIDALLGGA